MNLSNENSLVPLARAAFAIGLTRYGVFFSQLRLFLVRLERGIAVRECDWLNLAEYVFDSSAKETSD